MIDYFNTRVFLCMILLSSFIQAQNNNDCPSKSDKDYACGNVQEKILAPLEDYVFEIRTNFNVELNTDFRRRKDSIKAQKVLKLVNQVLNDNDFWKTLRHYQNYQYPRWSQKLNDDWTIVSNDQIINAFINKDPDNKSRPDRIDLDIAIKLYGLSFKTFFESAVAKDGGNGKVYNKRWFFRKYSVVDVGSNWVHEIAHSRGFRHCFKCNEERDYSIPYVINRIFKEVAQKYVNR